MNYDDCNWNDNGVRPFWDGRRATVDLFRSESPIIKRVNNLSSAIVGDKYKGIHNIAVGIEKVIDFDNLYNAFKVTKKGRGRNVSKLKFIACALDGLLKLKRLIETKEYTVSPYYKFEVFEPKKRVIEAGAFKDKIVQHSLCDNVLLPELKKEFIQANYAGQNGKGTHFALSCLEEHMLKAYDRFGYDCWIIKADVTKYYYNINHDTLKDILEYFFSDPDIIWLSEKFIDSTDGPGSPLGNQITQVFGLLYLSGLDHFVTGELGVDLYGRYTDDFYLIVGDRKYAEWCLKCCNDFVATLGLSLNGKTQIIPFKNGIKFCGFHTYITKEGKCIRKLTNEKKRAAKKKYVRMAKAVKNGKMSIEDFKESYGSFKKHLSYGNCVKLAHEFDLEIEKAMKR